MIGVLSAARPTWTARDASAVQQKLAKVGITTIESLAAALEGPLNDRLRDAGVRTFTAETICALREHLGIRSPRLASDGEEAVEPEDGSPASLKAPHSHPSAHSPRADAPETQNISARCSEAAQVEILEACPQAAVLQGGDSQTALPSRADGPLGTWISSHNNTVYEIRSLEESTSFCAFPSGVAEETEGWVGLWYCQRLATGAVVCGALKQAIGVDGWDWEAQLNNRGSLRFRWRGSQMVSKYRHPDAASWEPERCAERPQGYAFYDSGIHTHGHRYVHLGSGEGGGKFPIIGLTAGWLPVALLDIPCIDLFKQKKGEAKVRFLGTFCDPFDAAPSQAVSQRIRMVPPRPFGGHPGGQVLLTGDGGVTVQPPSRSSSLGASPMSKGWRKPGKGAFRPFSFAAKSGIGTGGFAQSVPAALNPAQTVAAAFGCTTSQLRDSAIFRGKLRQLPRRCCQQNLEAAVPVAHFHPSAAGIPRRPLISILCLRWYDYWSDPNPCSDYSILNDGYFTDLFQGPRSMGRLLPGEYEVYTVFVQGTHDLQKLKPLHLRSMLKGHNAAAWYFVWPSAEGTGFVREHEFFALCQHMERLPLRSCWPHESSLYRQLCGKLWIPQMSLHSSYRVPPTTRVHYAEFQRNGRKAALRALESLMRIRSTVWGKPSVAVDRFKGVVKLGFSWCGSDVLPFQGVGSLEANVRKLFENETCENTLCLVQEMVPDVVGEHRILCLYDKANNSFRKEVLWMQNVKESSAQVKHNVNSLDVAEFRTASSISMSPDAVTMQCFGGDRLARRLAEDQVTQLVERWLRWFCTESTEPPQCTRLDFLVTHPSRGCAEAWTCEVGECGASLCSVEVHGRNLAALNNAVLSDNAKRFPLKMPTEIPRNTGHKS
mmetsp:Transcript_63495/g.148012  ORF Transcript_63495/g.148012 Transcript_63495/m.148012 type:complete len:885 (-) Transcript_63495:29-2683(-)|eukprot:CAMPEP_0171083628 /NCGR_PEP_ID=MMETSP0766_2-20121228/17827_1 /TAXON_ID=439317 /ORGANISM="Gambierdiscus australes, Strain CAWD 149" /LENGTH=884 /DNA_ID=CAMNT_0011541069 /DNA_START=176 /DNA_END=2830 /DNA_ORIENTATION=+